LLLLLLEALAYKNLQLVGAKKTTTNQIWIMVVLVLQTKTLNFSSIVNHLLCIAYLKSPPYLKA